MARLGLIPKLPDGALRVRLGWLLGLGIVQTGLYLSFTQLSNQFEAPAEAHNLPLPQALGLLAAAFVLYLGTLWVGAKGEAAVAPPASKQAYARWALLIILGMSLLFRLILWPSHPIQEIDIYRYLWDGQVAAEGVAPYRYSPADVDRYADGPEATSELRQLANLRDRSPSLRTIFARTHHREVPSINPPLSQTVFALAALLTPDKAPVWVHVRVLKGLLLAFDLATVLLLLALLRDLNQPPYLLLVYAWCPLVLKEFANSGHMDSIAVCLLTATLLLDLRAARPGWKAAEISGEAESRAFMTGLFLGAATLAKLYPLLLLPLFIRWWWRRLGRRLLFPLSGYLLVLGAVYGPLLFQHYTQPAVVSRAETIHQPQPRLDPRHPLEGLGVFLTRWELNDFLFALVSDNLRTDTPEEPWYAVLPRDWRRGLTQATSFLLAMGGLKVGDEQAGAILPRLVVAVVFTSILIWLCRRSWPADGRLTFLQSVFLALAWLWFLNPAQNPWHWCWAMPLVLFARRPWWLVSAMTLIYYLRPWLIDRYPNPVIWGGYTGARFFDEVLVGVEHLPVLLILLGTWLRGRFQSPKRNIQAMVP